MKRRSIDESEKLSFNLTLGETIRLLYHVALDHCVLRSLEKQKIICASKEQLVSLLERGHSERKLRDLFELAEKKDLIPSSFESFAGEEKTNVLVITEDGGNVDTAANAFSNIEHEFPEWWSAPLPFVFLTSEKIILNEWAANTPIAKSLLKIERKSLPSDKEHFFVTLGGKGKSRTTMFRHLAQKIYLIEDVTQDMETAGDIVWWASVGKALAAKFEQDGKALWREGEKASEPAEESLVCEWDGESVGVLCIAKKKTKGRTRKK